METRCHSGLSGPWAQRIPVAGRLRAGYAEDLHHQLGVAVPICVNLTLLPEMTVTTLVTPRDLSVVVLEVLRLLPLGHLTAGVIMLMITFLPVADKASTFGVLTGVSLTVLPEG